jgi:predicted DCC family thiol-disulfide oxidoreductase YuxK
MITLADELTDRKERTARGWLFFDAECRFCTRIARWLDPVLRRRGLGVAPLQDPRVRALLACPAATAERIALSHERWHARWRRKRSAGCSARNLVGASANLARRAAGMMSVLDTAYRWVAARRGCSSELCEVK